MNRKVASIIMIMSILLTGCWDRDELNDVSIVTGIAIDPGEGKKYKFTVEVINSAEFGKQSAQGNAPVITYSLEGDSIPELTKKMNIGLSKILIYSHTRVLFINDKIAKEGMLGFLDFLERSGQFRNDFRILITSGDEASSFTKIVYPIQKSPSLKLHEQTNSLLEEWGGDPGVKLTDFISSIISDGRNPVTATIKIKGDANKGKMVENNQSVDPEALIYIDGLAIFEDEKMVGTLPVEMTRGYLWTQDIKQTSYGFPCDEDKKNESSFDTRIVRARSQIETTYKNQYPHIIVNVNGEANIQGNECVNGDITDINVFMGFEKKMEEYVKKDITASIEKVQEEFGVDIFGFGDALNRRNPKKFKQVKDQWDEEFAKAEVDVNVDLDLLRGGFRNKSYKTEIKNKE